uniref:Zf-RING_7 domain-containing protein n=1 Tax=Gongylonema pulchrum TaxID=637853 RepID=A0A183DCQ5_9BILA
LKALVDEQNRNRTKVMCRRCQGVVFGPKRAVLLEGTAQL